MTDLNSEKALAKKQKEHGYNIEIAIYGSEILGSDTWKYMQSVTHHGNMPRTEHCIDVARTALRLADTFHLKVDKIRIVRAGLLHDAFRYDWKNPEERHLLHAFLHGNIAKKEVCEKFYLYFKERNSIVSHMFPVAFGFPLSLEAWLITISDKICAVREYKKACNSKSFISAFIKTRFLNQCKHSEPLKLEQSQNTENEKGL